MLSAIPLAGLYLSKKRKQITRINGLVEKINYYKKNEPEKAKIYVDELYNFQKELLQKGIAVDAVSHWFANNSHHETQELIRESIKKKNLSIRIKALAKKTKMTTIYYQYTGPAEFKSLIEQRLEAADEQYQVLSLNEEKTPLVRVNDKNQESFVMRFLQMNSREEASGISPHFALQLLDDVAQISKPYLLSFIEDDDHEACFLEFGEYYKHGNLGALFKLLRSQHATNIELNQLSLLYVQQLIEFFIAINQKNIWYTDLKPSNILLNNHNNLIISDIKGLIISRYKKIATNRIFTNNRYYSSTVYMRDNQINLERLQRQTLANTLYELVCGQPPTQIKCFEHKWKIAYDFNRQIFQDKIGEYIENLIRHLNMKKALPMTKLRMDITNFLANNKNFAKYTSDNSAQLQLADQQVQSLFPNISR